MGKIYILMGKSASGKDTIYAKLREAHSELLPVVTYTTRPIRQGEEDGREYHFVSEETMLALEEAGKILEKRVYHTKKGDWYYFTAEDGSVDPAGRSSYLMISTLEGYVKIRDFYGAGQVVPLYITLDPAIRRERAYARERKEKNPCMEEVDRRFEADEKDFSEENLRKAGITEHFENLDLEETLAAVEQRIFDVESKE